MKSEIANWNGRDVRYRPGKLHICLKRNTSYEDGISQVKKFSDKIECRNFFSPGVMEVYVHPALTLRLATDMLLSGQFRFVELEREGFF